MGEECPATKPTATWRIKRQQQAVEVGKVNPVCAVENSGIACIQDFVLLSTSPLNCNPGYLGQTGTSDKSRLDWESHCVQPI